MAFETFSLFFQLHLTSSVIGDKLVYVSKPQSSQSAKWEVIMMENNLVSLFVIIPSITPLTRPNQPTQSGTVPARLTTWPKSLGPLAS